MSSPAGDSLDGEKALTNVAPHASVHQRDPPIGRLFAQYIQSCCRTPKRRNRSRPMPCSSESIFDHIGLVAEAKDEVPMSVVPVILHDMPKDRWAPTGIIGLVRSPNTRGSASQDHRRKVRLSLAHSQHMTSDGDCDRTRSMTHLINDHWPRGSGPAILLISIALIQQTSMDCDRYNRS
jgi:hypothetical protein